ncbi:class I SAM-dependent methyltransferase [Clavibacter michiganensis]|uniref:class I SAM-dependent methyltransferase n=1 Tax=Clavibacter michiganensis TaxID=28447 RepID=UPI0005BC1CBB|nr:class I SAM-dependent methyltransferase [Clavibacter michiganensis]
MSLAVEHPEDRATARDRTFGSGGGEPYARALRDSGEVLFMSLAADDGSDEVIDISRWSADADAVDASLLAEADGPVLDVGCGPGRMVRAAMDAGLGALGIDVSPTVVEMAAGLGLPVLHRSVFERLPREGGWGTLLLLDGNIGIGGDAAALLARCAELLDDQGALVVETHPDPARDRTFECTVEDGQGRASDPFPWAQVGRDAIARMADAAGLALAQCWETEGRSFCRLVRA